MKREESAAQSMLNSTQSPGSNFPDGEGATAKLAFEQGIGDEWSSVVGAVLEKLRK